MKQRCKNREEKNLLPFHIIKAASEGDVLAINTVLKHYEGYDEKLFNMAREHQRENFKRINDIEKALLTFVLISQRKQTSEVSVRA